MVNVFSLALDGNKPVSLHFRVREFRCHDGTDTILIHPCLVAVLESIRLHFGKPVIITSGYRTEAWNARKNGAQHSQHCRGYAADIQVKGVAPSDVADFARNIMPDFGGVGRYKTFTHIDVRARPANWNK